jgi:hypothetical protein
MTHLDTLSDGVIDYMGSDEMARGGVSVLGKTPDPRVGIR